MVDVEVVRRLSVRFQQITTRFVRRLCFAPSKLTDDCGRYDGDSDDDRLRLEALWDIGSQSTISTGHQHQERPQKGTDVSSVFITSSCITQSDNQISARIEQQTTGPHNQAWFTASIAGSSMCRKLCHQLYTPKVKQHGIPLSVLVEFANSNSKWRDEHLSKLGVPSKWPEHWDFLAAITACSTDVYYHCLWLVVMRAIHDFGILEIKDGSRANDGTSLEVQGILERYRTESDHGAMRIAALVSLPYSLSRIIRLRYRRRY